MKPDYIKIRGARQHNLKNIDLDIPKNKLVVLTGVSGSGKSSLAFDTIYAEGQRRYVESLSSYARQFLGIMEKPDVDFIEGLSPAISIDQKTTSRNPRSTVGTVTEIYDYLRLLFARIGHPHCPVCKREIKNQSVDEIIQSILSNLIIYKNNNIRFIILSPIVKDQKGEFSSLFSNLKSKGFQSVRVDGVIKYFDDDFLLIKTNRHTIDVVIDRLSIQYKDIKDRLYISNLSERLSESVENAIKLSDGLVIVSQIKDSSFEFPKHPKKMTDHLFSEKFACPVDNIQLPEIEPRSFSFNSPHGACPTCHGLGKLLKINPNVILSKEISISEGGVLPFSNMFENDTWYSRLVKKVCINNNINIKIPIKLLDSRNIDILLYGIPDSEFRVNGKNRFGVDTHIYETFNGIINELERRHSQTESDWVRSEIEKYMSEHICWDCKGKRLKKESLSITVDGFSISDVTELSILQILEWINSLMGDPAKLSQKEKKISDIILDEITGRLKFLESVGVEYLTLNRTSSSLSGGESQRIRLASQIGSGLTGVLYVLDEPTIGLHQKDNQKLISTLKYLRDLGNSVIVVEHDKDMMNSADHIIDFGPGAGKFGGSVIAQGSLQEIKNNEQSITGGYLSNKKTIKIVKYYNENNNLLDKRIFFDNKEKNQQLSIKGCSLYNLKNIDIDFPLGKLVVITGVSGSGKSTLLVDTLYPALSKYLNNKREVSYDYYKQFDGFDNVKKVILIDQSPIGRTPRSNPATYTKLFDNIRELFSLTKQSRLLGYKKGRFSFNVKGGRCENCEGQGLIKIEMQFMNDIWITCDVCHGKRYNTNTLSVEYNDKNIDEVLNMTVDEALDFFINNQSIKQKLTTLKDVGLGYIQLGQPATTLSGGEAQRVKLSSELSKTFTGKSVYILDEPTTGLHFEDIEKLLNVLNTLVCRGNSVFVIEHNMDVINNADWIIDIGPGGGEFGGKIIFEGTKNEIINDKVSITGRYLKIYINNLQNTHNEKSS